MKNITSIIFIAVSILAFFFVLRPMYDSVFDEQLGLKAEAVSYDETIQQAKSVEKEIISHQNVISTIDPKSRERLEKFLPDNVDNVRLIIDINNIASNFSLPIRNIEVQKSTETTNGDNLAENQNAFDSNNVGNFDGKQYESIDLSFSVNASYENFQEFLKALERSLRLVDVTAISFSSAENGLYDFKVTIKTYWLK